MKVCITNNYGGFVRAKLVYFLLYPIWRMFVYFAINKQKLPKNYYIQGWYMAMLHVYLQRLIKTNNV